MRRAIDTILRRMKELSDKEFEFEYRFTNEGIEFYSDDYFKFQDEGVSGTKKATTGTTYKYKSKMPPPSAFSKYSSDLSVQFAIAKSIQQEGIEGQDFTKDFMKDRKIDRQLYIIYEELIHQVFEYELNNKII